MRRSLRLLTTGLMLSLMGCNKAPDETATGEVLYNYYCADCHKSSGHGKYLMGIPANRTTRMSQSSVTILIKNGHRSKPGMPPVPGISYPEARKITQYLWTLKD